MHDFVESRVAFEQATKNLEIYPLILKEIKCCPPKSTGKICINTSSEHHIYIRDSRIVLRGQQEVLKNLMIAPILLNSFPGSKTWERNFSRPEYARYQIENWLMNTVRLEDINLQLINVFLNFGVNEKDINSRLLINHSFMTDDIKSLISLFAKSTQHIRSSRNYISHRGGYYSDHELEKLIERDESTAFAKLALEEGWIKSDAGILKDIQVSEMLNRRIFNKQYCSQKRRELHRANLEIYKFCKQFNETLFEHFKKNLPRLPETSEA